MNRYALASTLPPSCNKLASSIPRRMTRRKETWTWTGSRRERDRAYPTPDHTYPLLQREKKKKRAIFFPFIRGRAGGRSTPPLLFLRPLRGTWSVSQKSRFYRPISRGAGSLRLPARARTHPTAYTYADTHTHTHARVRARAPCLGRMEPPTRHHHLYRLHARRRERRFAERSALRERAKTKRDCVPPRLRVASHSLRCSLVAPMTDRPVQIFVVGREREREKRSKKLRKEKVRDTISL